MAGSTKGGLDGNTNAGEKDVFLIKYNSAGTKHWTRQFGSWHRDGGSDVVATSAGDIFVTGSVRGDGMDGNTSYGLYDMYLAKYNSSGLCFCREPEESKVTFGHP